MPTSGHHCGSRSTVVGSVGLWQRLEYGGPRRLGHCGDRAVGAYWKAGRFVVAASWQMLWGRHRRGVVGLGRRLWPGRGWGRRIWAVCGGRFVDRTGGCRSCHSLGVECSHSPGVDRVDLVRCLCPHGTRCLRMPAAQLLWAFLLGVPADAGVCFFVDFGMHLVADGLHIVACAATLGCDLVIRVDY